MNWPNFISICRVVAVPVFVYLLVYNHEKAAFLVFIAASLSDAVDGFLARLTNKMSTLGTFLDPMADKLLAATAFVSLAVMKTIPMWLLIIVISRDIIISLGAMVTYFVTGTLKITPRPLGKVTTFFQFMTVSIALASPLFFIPEAFLSALFYATAVITVISGAQYVYSGLESIGSEI